MIYEPIFRIKKKIQIKTTKTDYILVDLVLWFAKIHGGQLLSHTLNVHAQHTLDNYL